MSAAGHVYFILAPSVRRVKIGRAADPQQRLQNLQTGSAERLELLSSYPCADTHAEERRLHEVFSAHRVHREWFEAHESILIYARTKNERADSRRVGHPRADAGGSRMWLVEHSYGVALVSALTKQAAEDIGDALGEVTSVVPYDGAIAFAVERVTIDGAQTLAAHADPSWDFVDDLEGSLESYGFEPGSGAT